MEDKILWQDDVMYYEGLPIPIEALRESIRASVEKAERIMKEDVFLGIEPSTFIPSWKKSVRDPPQLTTPGWSFLNIPENGYADAGELFAKALLSHPVLGPKFGYKDPETGVTIWNVDFLERWLGSCADVYALLFPDMHTSMGMPARGSEACNWTFCNQVHRRGNFRAIGGDLAIMAEYSKTTNARGLDKKIVRFVHHRQRDILVPMLSSARHLEKVFIPIYLSQKHPTLSEKDRTKIISDYDTFIFVNLKGVINTHIASHLIHNMFAERLPHSLNINVSVWRHIWIGLSRKYLTSKLAMAPETRDLMLEIMAATQTGHELDTATARYAVDHTTSIPMLSDKEINQFRLVS